MLSPLPPVKKIKDEGRCLCLRDKAEAWCYDQGLARREEREQQDVESSSVRTKTEILLKHALKSQMGELYRGLSDTQHKSLAGGGFARFSGLLLVLSATGGHGVLPSSSPLGRSLETSTGIRSMGKSDARKNMTCLVSLMQQGKQKTELVLIM